MPNHPNLLKRKEKPRASHDAICGQTGLNHDAGDGGIVFTLLVCCWGVDVHIPMPYSLNWNRNAIGWLINEIGMQ